MSRVEAFITGVRATGTRDIADADLAALIKELAAETAKVSVDRVGVNFADNDVIEIAVPVVLRDDADRVGLAIADILDRVIANRIEWTEIRMRRHGP